MAPAVLMSKSATATYLYCVVKSARRPTLSRVPAGVTGAGAPAAHHVSNSLWLIAADVPLAIYGTSELEPRLRDLDWVARAALAHEGVVEYLARGRGAVVIPAKLFTMFSTKRKPFGWPPSVSFSLAFARSGVPP